MNCAKDFADNLAAITRARALKTGAPAGRTRAYGFQTFSRFCPLGFIGFRV